MGQLSELIERREMDVRCWQCDWAEARTLQWVSAQRHMNCPACAAVIVLDTSEVRREIALQRKQLAALHGQMVNLLQGADKISRRAQLPPRMTGLAPKVELALARSHPNTLIPSMRPAAAARRFPR
jgi:ribosomal protein S27E